MIKFNAEMLYAIAQEVELVRSSAHFMANTLPGQQAVAIPEPIRTEHPITLKAIQRHCNSIGLSYTAVHVERMLERLDGQWGGMNCTQLDHASQELHQRFMDEIKQILFLRVPADRIEFYDQAILFGQAVADNFKGATYDISEAGSCYATDRYTACVMHLMRALETALDAVGLGVGVPHAVIEARNSWDGLLKKISKQMDANDVAGDPSWPTKRQFFKDSYSQLFAVKNAWRNPSMHLEKKYDEKDAKRIYNAVKDFMEHVATHLDDAGTFTP
jgi:hypothetical protein